MEKVVYFAQFEEKKTHISLCIIVHLCTIATVPVHICTGTVELPFNILMFPFIILMFYLYGIKSKYFTPFLSLLSLASRNTMPQLSPYFIPELPLIFSLRLIIAHCHHHRKLCDRVGVFVAPWGGSLNLEVSLSGFGAIFSKKGMSFSHLRFSGLFCFLVSSKILESFSKLVWILGFLVLNFF